MILIQLLIGAGMIVVTISVHAGFMWAAFALLRRPPPPDMLFHGRALRVVLFVLWFFCSIVVQCWTWAVLLLGLGALGTFEEALYFSTVTYTTLGYGDIVLTKDWRLLGSFASTNGAIVIGWTTALVFLIVERVYGVSRFRG